jgi:hypothetical protein
MCSSIDFFPHVNVYPCKRLWYHIQNVSSIPKTPLGPLSDRFPKSNHCCLLYSNRLVLPAFEFPSLTWCILFHVWPPLTQNEAVRFIHPKCISSFSLMYTAPLEDNTTVRLLCCWWRIRLLWLYTSPTQQIVIVYPQCTRPCSRFWRYNEMMSTTNTNLALRDLELCDRKRW